MLNPPLFMSFCFEYTHLIFELNMFVNFLKPGQNYLDTMQILTCLVKRILFYDFLEERDGQLLLPLEIFVRFR